MQRQSAANKIQHPLRFPLTISAEAEAVFFKVLVA
jgi:hypothetical protein